MKEKTDRKTVNMTEGSIPRLLIAFAIPLLLGNLFQQLYNMVDTWVLGNFVSNEAFSAVGTVTPIVNLTIGLFMGFSSGTSVVIAQYFGAGREESVQKTVHTGIALTVLLTVIMTALGLFLTPTFLHFMKVPAEVYPDAKLYLTIYFAGVGGLLFYNMGASILQAIGDSRRPFYFLMTSAVLNIIGDLVFVLAFHRGVDGVAIATILSQAVSAFLTIATLVRTRTCVRLHPSKLGIDPHTLRKIIHVGVPAALQMAVISFSNIFVQAYINYFGPDVMSAWTAYIKIDAMLFLPVTSLSLAVTTFVGQNIGVGNVDRVRKGVRSAQLMAILVTAVLLVPVMLFSPVLVAFFNATPGVVENGNRILRVVSPFYLFVASANIHAGALRGVGNTRAPMLITIGSYVLFRQIYLFVTANYVSNTMLPIVMGYPLGWIVCTVLMGLYYYHTDLLKDAV